MFNGRRQPSRGGTSRMTRECQVRFCEGLGVKFPGPTRQTEKNSVRAYVFRLSSNSDIARRSRHVSNVPLNETARAVGRCGMAVPAIDGTMRASYLMMMRGQKQIVQHDDLAISSTALGAHRT